MHMAINTSLLNQIVIVLVRPKIPENIGAAARIAYNMGISHLILVRDELPERESMAKMATHKAAHLIDNLVIHSSIEEAIADCSLVIGTTARRGRQRCAEQSPREIINEIVPLLGTNRTALLFGPEDTGLTNDELKFCQFVSAIPTADFSSLNLAQAVAIHCYELYYGAIHMGKDMAPAPQLATSFELESMYSFLEKSLYRIEFIDTLSHNHWMNNIRRFFGRLALTSKETNIIRGICKKFMQHNNT